MVRHAVKTQRSKVDALEAEVAEATERLLHAASSSSAAQLDTDFTYSKGDDEGSGGVKTAKGATTAEAVGGGPDNAVSRGAWCKPASSGLLLASS